MLLTILMLLKGILRGWVVLAEEDKERARERERKRERESVCVCV